MDCKPTNGRIFQKKIKEWDAITRGRFVKHKGETAMIMTLKEARKIEDDCDAHPIHEQAYARGFLKCWNQMAPVIEALRKDMTGIEDWLNEYAEEFCDAKRVAEAKERIHKRGTLGYLSELLTQSKKALAQIEKIRGE